MRSTTLPPARSKYVCMCKRIGARIPRVARAAPLWGVARKTAAFLPPIDDNGPRACMITRKEAAPVCNDRAAVFPMSNSVVTVYTFAFYPPSVWKLSLPYYFFFFFIFLSILICFSRAFKVTVWCKICGYTTVDVCSHSMWFSTLRLQRLIFIKWYLLFSNNRVAI